MMGKPLTSSLMLLVGLLGACAQNNPQPSENIAVSTAMTKTPSASSASAAPTSSEAVTIADDPAVPVEDDYIEQAQKQITQENLESQLDALEEEIGGPD
jgi:hypothetical protein